MTRLVLGVLAVINGFGALAAAERAGELTTYHSSFAQAGALVLAAGLALVAAGLVSSFLHRAGGVGSLAVVAGYVWFSPFWTGWAGGPPLVRSLGMVAEALTFPLLLHLVLLYPTGGRGMPRVARLVVAAVYIEVILSTAGRALFRDPFLDPFCWSNCTDNVFLVQPLPTLSRGIQHLDVAVTTAAAMVLGVLVVWRWTRASRPARLALWPILPGGLLLAAATIAHSQALVRTPVERPAGSDFRAAFVAECVAVVLIAAALVASALRIRAQRQAVSRIVTDLGDAPATGSLRSALGQAVGDPALEIAYWLPSSNRYVNDSGQPVAAPQASAGKVVTLLVRDGQPLAAVTHSTVGPDLAGELGAAVRFALENGQLQAEVRAQLEDLRSSRARIVRTGDAHRQRLERDLHDGAQQDLLALLFEIRLARSQHHRFGDTDTAELLADAECAVRDAVDELRDLASGIYPAVLAQVGLSGALITLAERAPVPVEVDPLADQRYPTQVEVTAYLVVADAIDDAYRRAATHATVRVTRQDDKLVVEVGDDGAARSSSLIHLEDRVGALGGRLTTGPGCLRAEVPCG